jgi:hypothetical protein
MNIPPVIVTQKCSHCGALSQTKGGKCWLCYESMNTPNPFAVSPQTSSEPSPSLPMSAWDIVFSCLLGICVLLTLLIGIGLVVQDVGMLIPFAILVGPAYLVTVLRGLVATRSGNPRPASLLLTFVVSLLVTVSIAILLLIGTIIVLFLVCLGQFRNM